ncbi:MAG: hypothetical protein ACHREM_23030 [Polyangiales bacterium]
MSAQSRLVDFQVHDGATLPGAGGRVTSGLYVVGEHIRLWLRAKEPKIKAPFRKLVGSLVDQSTPPQTHDSVMNALGVCIVQLPVELETLLRNACDHRWVLPLVQQALSRMDEVANWRSDELYLFVDGMLRLDPPFRHDFKRFARTDKKSGVRFVPWLSAEPDVARFGVRRFRKDGTDDDVVLERQGLVSIESEFNLAKSVIVDGTLVLVGKDNNVLAEVTGAT